MSYIKNILTILRIEKKTALRGFIVCFIVILPLTFLPIIKDGLTQENIVRRLPVSILYAAGMSLAVVIAAVANNYESLKYKKKYLEKAAFRRLGWEERFAGAGSIVNELEPYLFGKTGPYYFRINITEPTKNDAKIEIIPFIDIKDSDNLKKILKKEHGFQQREYFGLLVPFTKRDLEHENFLLDKIANLASTLEALGAKPVGNEL